MASSEHEFLLPRVAESDLLNLVFEDVIDPTHKKRWLAFAQSNKVLAREVLMRVHVASEGDPDRQKKMLDEITYVYAALAETALRLSTGRSAIIVGDDGEYLQPSA